MGEMQVISRPLSQSALDGGGLVGSVVVQDQVHVEVRGYGCIDPVEEAPELRGSVSAVAGADDLPRAHGQQWGRPLQGLDLGFIVDTQHQGPLGWIEVDPDDVADLLDEQGIGRKLERLGPMRL